MKTNDADEHPETWTERITRYRKEGVLTAGQLWASDPVAACQLWQQALKDGVPPHFPASDTKKTEDFLKVLAQHVAEDLHQINAEDSRLSITERDDVLKAQQRHKAEIPENRRNELIEYALASEPMTDAELRQLIIKGQREQCKQPLTEQEIRLRIQAQNWGCCQMSKLVDHKVTAMTIGERIMWARAHAAKGPQTKEESVFVDNIRRGQERRRMNLLSVENEELADYYSAKLNERYGSEVLKILKHLTPVEIIIIGLNCEGRSQDRIVDELRKRNCGKTKRFVGQTIRRYRGLIAGRTTAEALEASRTRGEVHSEDADTGGTITTFEQTAGEPLPNQRVYEHEIPGLMKAYDKAIPADREKLLAQYPELRQAIDRRNKRESN